MQAPISASQCDKGEFSNEKGATLSTIWAKRILRVSGHYIEVEAL
jgi:hypothetical protein